MNKPENVNPIHSKLKVGIIAYTTFQGGGLMNFLVQAIQSLSQARPNWEFHVMSSISLPEMERCRSANVKLQYWDNDFATGMIFKIGNLILRLLGKESDAGFLLQKRAEMYGFRWGDQKKRQELIEHVDVLWLPYYNISLDRLAFTDKHRENLPVLMTIHDIQPYFYPGDHPAGDINRFFQGMLPFARSSQSIVTHSQFQKKAICDNLCIDKEKVFVTPQPPLNKPQILQKEFQSVYIDEILMKYRITRSYGFYPASTTHEHKNHLNLFKAWAKLKIELGDNCPLLVCTGKGSRAQYQRMLAQIKLLHLEEDVIFTGGIDSSVLAVLYQNCSFVVIPTLFEGAGSGILTDALMVGTPVACSDLPQIREQLTALGDISINFFNPDDIPTITKSMLTIINDIESQKRIALKNQLFVNQIFEKMWHRWAEDYARIIISIADARYTL